MISDCKQEANGEEPLKVPQQTSSDSGEIKRGSDLEPNKSVSGR